MHLIETDNRFTSGSLFLAGTGRGDLSELSDNMLSASLAPTAYKIVESTDPMAGSKILEGKLLSI